MFHNNVEFNKFDSSHRNNGVFIAERCQTRNIVSCEGTMSRHVLHPQGRKRFGTPSYNGEERYCHESTG